MSDPFVKKKYNQYANDPFDDKTDVPKDCVPKITSSRTFGVELEIYGGDNSDIAMVARKMGHFNGHDGSIRDEHKNQTGIELMTSVLTGEEGAKSLRTLMDECTKRGFKVNGTCGTHVHLGGGDFFDKNKFEIGGLSEIKDGQTNILFEKKLLTLMIESHGNFDRVVDRVVGDVSYSLGKTYTNEYQMVNGKFSRYCVVPVIYFGDTQYLVIRESTLTKMGTSQKELWQSNRLSISKEKSTAFNIPPKDVVLVYKPETEKFKKLKKLFYFYTSFDDILFSMLPKERRSNNFCKKLSASYSVKDIQKCKNQGELEKIWYQKETYGEVERDKRSSLQGNSSDSLNRDSSVRYHGTNFHSLYYKHGTVEIRMHHGTLNPDSILLWTQLHQRIMDAISNNEVSDEAIAKCAKGYDDVYDGGLLLIEALNIKGTNLEAFIKHRIKKYN